MSLGKSIVSEIDEEEKKSDNSRVVSQAASGQNEENFSPDKYERILDVLKSEEKVTPRGVHQDQSSAEAKSQTEAIKKAE